jgi:hypothetical protein
VAELAAKIGVVEVREVVQRMLEVLHAEFNHLLSTMAVIGVDAQGEGIASVSHQWVLLAESLFADLFEHEGGSAAGVLDPERLQYFLMALLLNEIRPENKAQMPLLIAKQTSVMLSHMLGQSCAGLACGVSVRQFKQYLLMQRLRREAELLTLKGNLARIAYCWRLLCSKQSLIMADTSGAKGVLISKLPMPALHSMIRVLSKTSRLPHLLHRICKVDTLKGQAQVSNTDATLSNHFRLLKYYASDLCALGTAYEFLEGTYLNASHADMLAEKLL